MKKIKEVCKWYVDTLKEPADWTVDWFLTSIGVFGILPVLPLYISAIKHGDMLFRFVLAYFWTILILVLHTLYLVFSTEEWREIWKQLKSKVKK